MGCQIYCAVGFVSAAHGRQPQGGIPRAPGAIPTFRHLQRSIPRPRPDSGGDFHGRKRRFPRSAAPGVNPTRSRGNSHGIQGRFPRSDNSRGNSHRCLLRNRRSDGVSDLLRCGIRLCCQRPAAPGANPTASGGNSHGRMTLGANPTGSRGISHALRRSIPRSEGSRGISHALRGRFPHPPEANPTDGDSRVDSHAPRRSIPRSEGSRGESHDHQPAASPPPPARRRRHPSYRARSLPAQSRPRKFFAKMVMQTVAAVASAIGSAR